VSLERSRQPQLLSQNVRHGMGSKCNRCVGAPDVGVRSGENSDFPTRSTVLDRRKQPGPDRRVEFDGDPSSVAGQFQ